MMPSKIQNNLCHLSSARTCFQASRVDTAKTKHESDAGKALDTRKAASSKSIPISENRHKRTPSEAMLDEEEAIADHRDYVMYQRIIHGIRSRQRLTQDSRWWKANEITLMSVYEARTRQVQDPGINPHFALPAKQQAFDQNSLVGLMTNASTMRDDEDTLPFPLEM